MGITPEGKVKKAVKKVIDVFNREFDALVYTNWPVPGGYGESMLDCVGCAYGVFFMVETKAPGKSMTDRQKQCAARVEAAGGRVFEIDSFDPESHQLIELWVWLVHQKKLYDEGRERVRVRV